MIFFKINVANFVSGYVHYLISFVTVALLVKCLVVV